MTSDVKTFAPGRERDENGWLIYPRDAGLRKSMYPEELYKLIVTHPAKQNAYLCQDICEFVSEPGETVLDPFGGVGTTLLWATHGRHVVLTEIESFYAGIVRACIEHINATWPPTELLDPGKQLARMSVIQADNRIALPIPCDHIVTSPPYGDDLAKEASTVLQHADWSDEYKAQFAAGHEQYGAANQNIGRLPKFIYTQAMNRVYELMVQSVRVGGTISITHRDRIEGGKRVLYIHHINSTMIKLGCVPLLFDKWHAPGSIQSRVNEKLGNEVVLDEDILIFRRAR